MVTAVWIVSSASAWLSLQGVLASRVERRTGRLLLALAAALAGLSCVLAALFLVLTLDRS